MGADSVTVIPFSPSITDGDLVPGTALLTPDGKPGIKAEYFNATGKDQFATRPVLTRTETSIVSRAAEFKQVSDQHRVCWSGRSEERTSELQSLMRISYAVFCLQKKKQIVRQKIAQCDTIEHIE